MNEIFRPRHQPAQLIYDAFQATAKTREGIPEEWIAKERNAVWVAAKTYADQNGLPEPTLQMVEQAETYAYGSADYGAKWAYKLAELMGTTPSA